MANSAGTITLTRAYDPYGVVTGTNGTGQSRYGFTNEYQEGYNNLVYLRTRYYSSATGRFLTRDTWQGDYNRPGSLNRWNYAEENPINAIDPSGYISEKQAERADLIWNKLNSIYGINIKKDWGYKLVSALPSSPIVVTGLMFECEWESGNWRDIRDLESVFQGVKLATIAMGGSAKLKSAMKNYPVYITRLNISDSTATFRTVSLLGFDIVYTNYGFNFGKDYVIYETIHELGHIWDIRSGFQLSNKMSFLLGTTVCSEINYSGEAGENGYHTYCWFDIYAGKELPPGYIDRSKNYASSNALEDWAEAFANYVDPAYYASNANMRQLFPIRRQYVEDQINAIP